jgi:hypothetical protein
MLRSMSEARVRLAGGTVTTPSVDNERMPSQSELVPVCRFDLKSGVFWVLWCTGKTA